MNRILLLVLVLNSLEFSCCLLDGKLCMGKLEENLAVWWYLKLLITSVERPLSAGSLLVRIVHQLLI